jgi:hypothetical protein
MNKNLDKLYVLYWFLKMSRTVRKFVDKCLICKSSKNHTGKTQMQMPPPPPQSFSTLAYSSNRYFRQIFIDVEKCNNY